VNPRPTALVAGNKRTMMPVPVVVVTAIALAGLAGCGSSGVTGKGPVQTETRKAGAFTRIGVSGGIGVTVRIDPTQALEVSAQENILPVIATDVEGDTLRIRSTESYSTSEGVEVAVSTPALLGISMSGGSQGRIEGLDAERLDIELNGGAGVTATGSATSVGLNMTGGSRASLENLMATTITLDLSGGATATVHASDRVSGSASGGSRTSVLGDAQLDVEVSGGAEVTRD
jgi:hypothetical protein